MASWAHHEGGINLDQINRKVRTSSKSYLDQNYSNFFTERATVIASDDRAEYLANSTIDEAGDGMR